MPDRLCVITYVSQLHAHFKNATPDDGAAAGVKREAIGKNWRDKAGNESQIIKKYSRLVLGHSLVRSLLRLLRSLTPELVGKRSLSVNEFISSVSTHRVSISSAARDSIPMC